MKKFTLGKPRAAEPHRSRDTIQLYSKDGAPIDLSSLVARNPIILKFDPVTATSVDKDTNSPVATATVQLASVGLSEVDQVRRATLKIEGKDTAAVRVELVGPGGELVTIVDWDGGWDYPDDYDAEAAKTPVTIVFVHDGGDRYLYESGYLPEAGIEYKFSANDIKEGLRGAQLTGQWELRVTALGVSDAPIGPMIDTVTAEIELLPAAAPVRPDLDWLPGEETRMLVSALNAGITTSYPPKLTRSKHPKSNHLIYAEGNIVKPAGVALQGTHNLIDDLTEGGAYSGWGPGGGCAFYVAATNVTDGYTFTQILLHVGPVEIKAMLPDGSALPTAKELWIPLEGKQWPGRY